MATIHRSALVRYTPAQMYRLVDDIDAYPEFLPWCHTSKVLRRTPDEVEASLEIAHSGLHKSFATRNRLEVDSTIHMQLLEGPFKHLDGIWRFTSLGDAGCKVVLDLDFEFSNKLLGMTFGKLFNQIATTLVDAFTHRAEQVYGPA